jgi:serine/threonine-protein kinase
VNPAEENEVRRLLQGGLVTQAQIDDALAVRAQMAQMGLRPRSVAEVLVEKGLLEQEDLEAFQREEHEVAGREQIAGYQLLELLGRGSLGTVYKARQISLDRVVAIKVLDPDLARDDSFADRFLDEARRVARLSHTNLISGIDVGEEDGIRYLVMEYADGVTVARLLRRGGAMDEERSLEIAAQVARALDYAHRHELVHGEVKPDNIILTRDGVAKLCDLGLARGHEDDVDEEGFSRRSPDYVSPEQVRGAPAGPAADVYGLGATLFHMVIGRPPFLAENREAIVAKHLTEPAPSARQLASDVSEPTDAILRRCLAKRPDERYPNAAALAADLDQAVRRLKAEAGAPLPPTAAPTPGPARPAPSTGGAPVRRRRRRR